MHRTERTIDPLGHAQKAGCSPGVKPCKGRNAFLLRGACQRWVRSCTWTKAAGKVNQPFDNKEKLARSSPSKGTDEKKILLLFRAKEMAHENAQVKQRSLKILGTVLLLVAWVNSFALLTIKTQPKSIKVGINYLKSIYYYKCWVLWPRFDCCQVGQARNNMRFPVPSSKELRICKRCSRKNLMLEYLELNNARVAAVTKKKKPKTNTNPTINKQKTTT